MYNVAWGQNRIVNKTRRDITQKLEKLDQLRELTRKSSGSSNSSPEIMSSPKPTFQNISNRNRQSNGRHHQEQMSPQHLELVRFFNDSWQQVRQEMSSSNKPNGMEARDNSITYYKRPNVHPSLKDFEPFDLDTYWGHKVYTSSTQSR